MELRTARLLLRPWRRGDEAALVTHADHREVWRNLADFFPHPYTPADAADWIAQVGSDPGDSLQLAIVAGDEPVGGIGLSRQPDVARRTGVLGYWLGPTAWGRGYATEALRTFTAHVFEATDIARLEARVFEWNPASGRVLEKAGFVREGRLRQAASKDGHLIDVWLYARTRA
jgi:RimJ/RimL family protein N-acetyltransferase